MKLFTRWIATGMFKHASLSAYRHMKTFVGPMTPCALTPCMHNVKVIYAHREMHREMMERANKRIDEICRHNKWIRIG